MVLSLLQDSHGLVVCNVVATSSLPEIVRHVTDTDAPVAVVVGATFIQFLTAVTAGTDSHSDMAFISLEPI